MTPPCRGTACLRHGDGFPSGMGLHQLPPIRDVAAALPTPATAEVIQSQAIVLGAGTGEDGSAAQISRQLKSQLFSSTAVSTQQWDAPLASAIEDKHRRIVLLSPDERCDQAGHRTDSAHNHQNVVRSPVF